jgi:hypothetical protein
MPEHTVDNQPPSSQRKVYVKPAITHELKLETRAGTPVPTIRAPLVDPLGLDPNKQQ